MFPMLKMLGINEEEIATFQLILAKLIERKEKIIYLIDNIDIFVETIKEIKEREKNE